jgi:hypothetical protein
VRALAPAVHDGVVETFARALHTVFVVCVPIAVVMFLLAFCLRQIPLREHPDTPLEPPHTAGEELALTYEGASIEEGRVSVAERVSRGPASGARAARRAAPRAELES